MEQLADDLTREESEKKTLQTALTALEKEVKEKEKESGYLSPACFLVYFSIAYRLLDYHVKHV